MGTKFNLQSFMRQSDTVAALLTASEVFGFLTRSIDLPSQWAALVSKDSGAQSLIQPGAVVEAEGVQDVLFARTSPIHVEFEEEGLVANNDLQCIAKVGLKLGVIPERGELVSFRQSVMGGLRVATSETVVRHFRAAVRASLREFASLREASTLVDASTTNGAATALDEALKGVCFTAGLRLAERPSVEFESQSLQRLRRHGEQMAEQKRELTAKRQLQQLAERAREDHLHHLAELLTRLRTLAEASPDVEVADLIRTFGEADRSELYEALLTSPSNGVSPTQTIVVAAGDELVVYDTASLESAARRLPMPGHVGPIRSVQAASDSQGRQALLIGAATGVYHLPMGARSPDISFTVRPVPTVSGGFNGAIVEDEKVFASHSELGIRMWRMEEPGKAQPVLDSMTRGASAVRGICSLDGELYCSIGDRVIRWRVDDDSAASSFVYTGAMATICAIHPSREGLYAGTSEGDVLYWPVGEQEKPQRLQGGRPGTGRAVESIGILESHGLRRLFFSDTTPSVSARVLGDSYTCRYEAGGQTLRRVDVADDLIVATNDVRDRLICWHIDCPSKPNSVIGVSQLCRRSIQDVCLLSQSWGDTHTI